MVVDMVSVDEKVGFDETGLNEYEVPLGNPDRVSDTGWAEPLTSVTTTLYNADSPAVTFCAAGETDRLKSKGGGAGLTEKERTAWLL